MEIKLKKLMYPAITFLFAAIVAAIVFYSMRFFSSSMSGIFIVDETKIAPEKTIDLQNYNLVAPRLGIKK